MGAISRFFGRLLLGREGVDSAAKIAQAARQRQQLNRRQQQNQQKNRAANKPAGKAAASAEREALLRQARETHARVDRDLDPETREQIRKTAARLMKPGQE